MFDQKPAGIRIRAPHSQIYRYVHEEVSPSSDAPLTEILDAMERRSKALQSVFNQRWKQIKQYRTVSESPKAGLSKDRIMMAVRAILVSIALSLICYFLE
jgi:hypothetical protein